MKCIFCYDLLTEATKPEHIFLQSLGGRKTSKKIICTLCNEAFGNGPDKALAESAEFIRNLIDYPSGKGNAPPNLKGPEIQGLKTVIRAGGTPEFVGGQPFKVSDAPEGKKNVELYIRSAEHMASVLPHLSAVLGLTEEETKQKLSVGQARRIHARLPLMPHSIQLGGPEAMRSMMKSCFTLWADLIGSEEVHKSNYNESRGFVRFGGDSLATKLCKLDSRAIEDESLTKRFTKHSNFVFVASNAEGRVLGYFRLYNICGWCFELCPSGGISNLRACYVFNPVKPNTWTDKPEDMPLDYEWIANSQYQDFDGPRNQFISMYEAYHKEAGPREISKIVDEVISDLGLTEDQVLSPKLVQRFQFEVAKRMAAWILGLQHEVPLTPNQLGELLNIKQNGGS